VLNLPHAARSFSTTEARQQDLLRYALDGVTVHLFMHGKRPCMAAENVDVGAGHSKMLAWPGGQKAPGSIG
jgi:hypothetical protein